MENDLQIKLQSIGLDDHESAIYLYLLKNGGTFPAKIASDLNLNRTTTYRLLTGLAIKGFVSEGKKHNKQFYQAERPTKLIHYGKRQISEAEQSLEDLREVMPELTGWYQDLGIKPKVRYFSGKEDVVNVYMDHVDVDKKYEMLAWANAPALKQFLPPKKFKYYVKTKESLGITTRGIIPESALTQKFVENIYVGIKKSIWPNLRYIPDEMFPYEGEFTIYGQDRVSVANLKNGKYFGLIIEDKTIHDMMKLAFELSWKGTELLQK